MLYYFVLLLPSTVCLFGAIWLLCKRESNTRAQNILILCSLLTVIFFFCTANYIAGVSDYVTYRRMDILDCFITPFIVPSIYLYFRALTYEGQFTWKDYIWFLPSLVVGIGTFVLYLAMDEMQVSGYITTVLINRISSSEYDTPIYRLHYLFSIQMYSFIALVQIIGTVTCAIIYFKRYHQRLREFYSDIDSKSICLDNTILYWFIFVIPFALCILFVEESFWQQHPLPTSCFFIGCTTVYFGIWYFGSKRKYTVEKLAEDLQQADIKAIRNNYDHQEEDTDKIESEKSSIQRNMCLEKQVQRCTMLNILINDERIYLQSTLRADELASKLHTNRTYLSKMIKDEFQCTFSDLINRKRIEYSQQLMDHNLNIKLADLAIQSGFTSASSFSRTFVQMVGIPPKAWLKRHTFKR